MKQMLCGSENAEPTTEVVATLAQEFYNEDVILIMASSLGQLDFEVMYLRVHEI